ncbi:MAG TPA: glycosyltransferase family 4 protein [Blastocatellia bacterium]|nr:glycosyltransferase family 4 protein [Blastocatellia bacterium]
MPIADCRLSNRQSAIDNRQSAIMKILSITAGAAGMYCGSCLRDNALAAELLRQGHDVLLVPIYTPTLTDEQNVSQHRVFFGGISVYLEQHVPLFRHTPKLLDRLWDSEAALNMVARRSIAVDPKSLAEMTISMLKGEDGYQRKELDKLIDWLRTEARPDVVNLPNSLLIALAGPMKRELNLRVFCTLQGEDLFINGLGEPHRSKALELIRTNVEFVDGFIAVSDFYAKRMCADLGIPETKMHVVPLGISFDGFEKKERSNSKEFVVGYFARVAPEKGLHVLCEAYRLLRQRTPERQIRLEVAGYLAPEYRDYFGGIERQMNDWGLGGEFHYRGGVDREAKLAFLRGLDAFSVPATYDEPKGMSLLEAMAAGVPVVQPRRGSFTEIVERTAGGLLVEGSDAESLAVGLLSLVESPSLAAELSQRAFVGVREHYGVSNMAHRAIEAYSSVEDSATDKSKEVAELAHG